YGRERGGGNPNPVLISIFKEAERSIADIPMDAIEPERVRFIGPPRHLRAHGALKDRHGHDNRQAADEGAEKSYSALPSVEICPAQKARHCPCGAQVKSCSPRQRIGVRGKPSYSSENGWLRSLRSVR